MKFTIISLILFALIPLAWFYFGFVSKVHFQFIKSYYGKTDNGIFGFNSINEFMMDLTKKLVNWFTVEDSTIIEIDDVQYPLIYGTVFFVLCHRSTTTSSQDSYYIISKQDNIDIFNKHKKIFKFADNKDDYSIFWVKNLKLLIGFLNKRQ